MALSYATADASTTGILARRDLSQLTSDIERVALENCRPKPKLLTLKVDHTDRLQVDAVAKEVEDKFGRLDILTNNAG